MFTHTLDPPPPHDISARSSAHRKSSTSFLRPPKEYADSKAAYSSKLQYGVTLQNLFCHARVLYEIATSLPSAQKLLSFCALHICTPQQPFPPSAHHAFFGAPPPQEAGVQLGDTLEQLDGVYLGSFQEAIERLKQRRGTVVLTLLRQKD